LEGHYNYGVDGDTGKMTDMKEYGLLESASVKIQTLKTAIEVCTLPSFTASSPLDSSTTPS
jgi:T-complex protein 1 subunit gamma